MVAFNQIIGGFQQQIALFNRRMSAFFSFIFTKIKHFTSLTLAEQIAFGSIGIGLIFIITSLILFLL